MDQHENSDDFAGPSRSQQRREALEIFELAEALVAVGPAELARIPLTDDVREEVMRTRGISAHIARKRQTQFLAKQMRKLTDEEIAPIREALNHDRDKAHRETAALHRVEAWRERLLEEGDEALSEWLGEFPTADRQHLRQLVRNAVAERKAGKPPHAYRELFRELKAVMSAEQDRSDID